MGYTAIKGGHGGPPYALKAAGLNVSLQKIIVFKERSGASANTEKQQLKKPKVVSKRQVTFKGPPKADRFSLKAERTR
jgi:hypothetical protein